MHSLQRTLLCCSLALSFCGSLGCKSDAERAEEIRVAAQVEQTRRDNDALAQARARQAAEEQAKREQIAQYKAAIEQVLHEDALTGKEPTAGHITAMQSIDLSSCPPELRVAYVKHIHAWQEEVVVARARAELDSKEDVAEAAGILTTMFGSDATPYSDFKSEQKKLEGYHQIASEDVTSTFESIEEIAAVYGARVPH